MHQSPEGQVRPILVVWGDIVKMANEKQPVFKANMIDLLKGLGFPETEAEAGADTVLHAIRVLVVPNGGLEPDPAS